jgi:hypothetical protein
MRNHDSRRDISRTLGALTPPAPAGQIGGGFQQSAQDSGLFDLGALYAGELERAIQRARVPREAPPPRRLHGPSVRIWDVEDVDVHILPEAPAPARPIARVAGWFNVAVTWLATTSLGFLVATSVPAHLRPAHVLPAPAVAVAAPPPAAVLAVPQPTAAPQAASAQVAAPPVVSLQDLPVAPATTAPATKAAPPPRATAAKKAAPPPQSSSPAPARASTEDAPRAPVKAAPVKAAAAGPISLDELIRQTVAAEQKHKQH